MGIDTARSDTGFAGGAGVAPIGGSGGGKRPWCSSRASIVTLV